MPTQLNSKQRMLFDCSIAPRSRGLSHSIAVETKEFNQKTQP
jgi:hypothetical protein